MKLAISNIAWDVANDEEIITLLKNNNVEGIEIAPAKISLEPDKATPSTIKAYRDYWSSKDFSIIAMQSLLFGRADLSIFGEKKSETFEYLKAIVTIGSTLSAKALVFGSPKNRLVGSRNSQKAREEALHFFSKLGNFAFDKNTFICIEANPTVYGCDFLTETLEGLLFVKELDHPGIKLQIDTGTMFINKEDPLEIIEQCMPYVGHVHISEPGLNLVGNENHDVIASCLKDVDYKGWISIEMKNNLLDNDVRAVEAALNYATNVYVQ